MGKLVETEAVRLRQAFKNLQPLQRLLRVTLLFCPHNAMSSDYPTLAEAMALEAIQGLPARCDGLEGSAKRVLHLNKPPPADRR